MFLYGTLFVSLETVPLKNMAISAARKVSNDTELIRTSGMYVVLYSGEFHRPQCALDAGVLVKKVVLKVTMTAIR